MVAGAVRYLREGLPQCDVITMATQEYIESEDLVGMFLDDFLELETGKFLSDRDLVHFFNQFAERQGMRTWKTQSLRTAIMEARPTVIGIKKDGVRGLKNIRLKEGVAVI
jgi:phage/plasmid-associated DNA primase